MITQRERAIRHASEVIKDLREQVGDLAMLTALGRVTIEKPIKFMDFPTAEVDEGVPVLKMGNLLVQTKRTRLGDRYSNVTRKKGTVTAAVTNRQELVMLRQFRGAAGMTFTELPAGGPKPGENRDSAAAREVTEETGYEVDRIETISQGTFSGPVFTDDSQSVHLARLGERGERSSGTRDAHEIQDIFTLPLIEVVRTIVYEGRMPLSDTLETKGALAVLMTFLKLNPDKTK
jgi:8-oxo-dGTP pyrophosphatase MutT (NUDIX family)